MVMVAESATVVPPWEVAQAAVYFEVGATEVHSTALAAAFTRKYVLAAPKLTLTGSAEVL